jgi:hypothetical protein
MARDYEFEVWRGGITVAAISAPSLNDAIREAWHYASIYAQDGDVQIRGEHASALIAYLNAEKPAAPREASGQ